MPESRDLVVVGAGLSGVMTAIQAAERGIDTLVIETLGAACERFRACGMGAAPVSNAGLDVSRFHGRHARFVSDALGAFDAQALSEWFQARGVTVSQAEHYGHIVADPHAADALALALEQSGAELRLSTTVEEIHADDRFELLLPGAEKVTAERLVLATGIDPAGHGLARALGHAVSEVFPAHGPLLVNAPWTASLNGLWMDVRLELLRSERVLLSREGSLLFAPEGLSGEVIFNISGEVAQRLSRGEALSLRVNFFPGMDAADVSEWMFRILGEGTRQRAATALDRMIPARLAQALLDELKVKPGARSMHLELPDREGLLANMLGARLEVTGTGDGAESALGGVSVREVDPRTFVSGRVPGLSVVGSLLDVSADWGGFEQHFSLASGYLAGRSL